jgi:cytochrome P450
LPLTRAVFDEAVRLYPPAWGLAREAREEDEIMGYTIPKGAIIIVGTYVTHRRPDLWPEPEQFRPERFMAASGARHKFAYLPFGGGPRLCIGQTFALMEGPLVLATLAQRFRVELAADHVVAPDPTFTLRPRNGVQVVLCRRS